MKHLNDAEKLMSEHPEIEFRFEPRMPDHQKGLIIGNVVYLNPRQSNQELAETVAEEISHYETTVGNIIDLSDKDNRKQEKKARDLGAVMLVSPFDIIECFEQGCRYIWECAEYIGVSESIFNLAVQWYSRKWDGIWTNNGYAIYFKPNGTIGVFKSLV